MTDVQSDVRLVRPGATPVQQHARGLATCVVLGTGLVAGLWSTPIAILAAGAGAGYSLSGSV